MGRRPYLLQPDRPAEGELRQIREGETETKLSPAWEERAREAGVTMRRPRWNPNTVPAHIATMYAKEQGLDDEFHHAAAKAFWENGINLGGMPEGGNGKSTLDSLNFPRTPVIV